MRKRFLQDCRKLGLRPSDLGRSIRAFGHDFEIVGLSGSEIIVKRLDTKRLRHLGMHIVLAGLMIRDR